jgi:lactate dehydrogenase-like 2-hydroxyacid dehydrogenase
VAEHAFALMMAVAKRLAEADSFTRSGQYRGWAPELFLGVDLTGRTLGIVGLGRIGSRVAHFGARGFDMKVIYYDVSRNEQFEKESGAVYCAEVDELLKQADFVSVHVPLLDSTRHLIDARRLRLMKRTAILVNTSRGPVVDEAALVAALRDGIIRGAALDVFECEPAIDCNPLDHLELKALSNVILTPHTASATEETRQAMSRLAAENIMAVLKGEPPPNLV